MQNRTFEDTKLGVFAYHADVGGTDCYGGDATLGWLKLGGSGAGSAVKALVYLSTFNDTLDTVKWQQATDDTGTGAKDLSTSGSGATYNFNTALKAPDTAGDIIIMTASEFDLDMANDFTHVRALVGASGNTGVDMVSIFYVMGELYYTSQQPEGVESGTLFYVNPNVLSAAWN